jgi:hypothetical protein
VSRNQGPGTIDTGSFVHFCVNQPDDHTDPDRIEDPSGQVHDLQTDAWRPLSKHPPPPTISADCIGKTACLMTLPLFPSCYPLL